MTRRGNGEGSIYQSGSYWVAALSMGAGRRKVFRGKSRQVVQRKLAQARRDLEEGVNPSEETVGAYLIRWLDGKRGIDEKSWLSYESKVRIHCKPIHKVRLSKLTPAHLQALYAGIQRSPQTVKHIRTLLSSAFQQAEDWGLVRKNPARMVPGPKVPKHEYVTFDQEQAGSFIAAVQDDRLEALYIFAIGTAARQGEIFSLRWEDLDGDSVSVRHTLTRPRGGGYNVKENKSDSSRRMIPLQPFVMDALRRHKVKQAEERLASYVWDDTGFVFTDSIGHPLRYNNFMRRNYYPLLERNGLPKIRFHDLRHTVATLLLTRGVNPKVVSEMLGHASVKITLDRYSHVTPSMRAEASRTLEEILLATPAATPEDKTGNNG